MEAFAEVKNNPEKYGKKFKTMMPNQTWLCKTVAELKELACNRGDHIADWVEQALEWAQRISNGESWETVCNNADTAKWFRLVVWKNGYACIVGGSSDYYECNAYPASDVFDSDYDSDVSMSDSVPLVVLYEK